VTYSNLLITKCIIYFTWQNCPVVSLCGASARSRTEVLDQEEAAPHREKRHALQPAQPRWTGRKSKIQITKTATPNIARTLSGGSGKLVRRPYPEGGSEPVEYEGLSDQIPAEDVDTEWKRKILPFSAPRRQVEG
jgi:hypothetical protein